MIRLDHRNTSIVALLLCLLLCGCADAPDANSNNGISYALTETDREVLNIIENSADTPDTSLENEYFVCSIQAADNILNINAEACKEFKTGYSFLSAEPYPGAVKIDMVEDIFFQQGHLVREGMEPVGNELSGQADKAIFTAMNSTKTYYLDSSDGNIHFCGSDAGFTYCNDELVTLYKQVDFGEVLLEDNNVDISEQFTVKQAEEQIVNTLSEILDMPVKIYSCKTVHNGNGAGYYDFHIVPVLGNHAIAINDLTVNADNVVDVFGRVIIGQEGISQIEATNFLWKSLANGEEENFLSFAKVKTLLQYYMEKDSISASEYITFTKAELVWFPTTNDWSTANLIPVWRFYVPNWERTHLEPNIMQNIFEEHIPLDICIDAVTGELVRLE